MTNGVCSFPAPSAAQWSCFAWLHTTITLSAQYQNTDCFCQHTMDHQYPAGGSSALSRVTLCGGGCQVSQIWSPPVNSVTCHVSRVVTRTLRTLETGTLPPHISTYLHVSAVSAAVSLSPVSTQIRRHLTRHCSRRGDTAALPIQWRILNYDK